jgi:CheY-like chemotaxis protein
MKRILNLRCPTCGKVLLVRRDDEQRVLRTRILIFNNGSCFSKCPFCKSEVAVPIKLADALDDLEIKEAAGAEQPRASLTPIRQRQTISLGQLLCDLEKPVAPLAAYVQKMLSNGGKKAKSSEVEKLNECMMQVRRLGDLMERYLGKCKSSEAGDNGGRRPPRRAGLKDKKMAALSGKSVLVIDSDQRVRQFFRLSLGLAGADVTCAESHEQGIELVRTRRFDAVFVEIVLPAMTGLVRLLEETEKDNTHRDTVVYVVTKEAVKQHIDTCMRLGASGVIDKSVSLEDVATLLQKSLQGEVANAPLKTCGAVADEKGA